VRIFIDSPTSTRCKNNVGSQGNFNDTAGFNNQLLGTGGVTASSGLQVYVVGDGAYDDNTTVHRRRAGGGVHRQRRHRHGIDRDPGS
jgi:hypothetical protein